MPGINYISEARKRHRARPEPRRRRPKPSESPRRVKFHFPWANGPVERPYLFPAGSSDEPGPSQHPTPDTDGQRKKRHRRELTLEDVLASDIAGIRRPPPILPPRIARPGPPPKERQHRHPWFDSPERGGLFQVRHGRAVPIHVEPDEREWDRRAKGQKGHKADRPEPSRRDLHGKDAMQPKSSRSHRNEWPGRTMRQAAAVEDDRRAFALDLDLVPAWQDTKPSPSRPLRASPLDRPSRPPPHLARPREEIHSPVALYPRAWSPPPPLDQYPLRNVEHEFNPQLRAQPPHLARQRMQYPVAQPPRDSTPVRPSNQFPDRYDPFQRLPVLDELNPPSSSSNPIPTPTPAPRPLVLPHHAASTQVPTPTPAPQLPQLSPRLDASASPRTHDTPSSQLSAYEHARRRAQPELYGPR